MTETARVVEAVSAYYEAGRRPPTTPIAASDEPPAAPAGGEPVLSPHQAAGRDEPVVTAGGQSLSELADELEALIESIRYGDDAAPGNPA